MEKRRFGRTGLDVSVLTFGCGAVGGLMTRGEAADQDRAVAWARDNGINHFDTAPLYGNGASEENLGRALGNDRKGVIVSTKVRLAADQRGDYGTAIQSSLEASLRRLKQDQVDLFQLHNTLGARSHDNVLSAEEVLDDVIPAFERLQEQGKVRFLGFTANGDVDAIHALVKSGRLDSGQFFFNALNPSAGEAIPSRYPGDDYRQILAVAKENGVGSIGVRVLAGGALSGSETRNPLGMPLVDPIGSGRDYATDVARSRRFQPLLEAGYVESLPELAIRFAISNPDLTTTEIGIASLQEVQLAARAVNKGPLPGEALTQLDRIRREFVGEQR